MTNFYGLLSQLATITDKFIATVGASQVPKQSLKVKAYYNCGIHFHSSMLIISYETYFFPLLSIELFLERGESLAVVIFELLFINL